MRDRDDKRRNSDADFLAACRVETYRGPGPGGQKRNKTSSAVRITHEPTGLSATASERRSQSQNRAMAVRRLRVRLAIELREPVDLTAPPPEWFTGIIGPAGKLAIAESNGVYPAAVGLVLDALAAVDWSPADAGTWLGVSSSQLVKFLHADPAAWTAVQRERSARRLRPLL